MRPQALFGPAVYYAAGEMIDAAGVTFASSAEAQTIVYSVLDAMDAGSCPSTFYGQVIIGGGSILRAIWGH